MVTRKSPAGIEMAWVEPDGTRTTRLAAGTTGNCSSDELEVLALLFRAELLARERAPSPPAVAPPAVAPPALRASDIATPPPIPALRLLAGLGARGERVLPSLWAGGVAASLAALRGALLVEVAGELYAPQQLRRSGSRLRLFPGHTELRAGWALARTARLAFHGWLGTGVGVIGRRTQQTPAELAGAGAGRLVTGQVGVGLSVAARLSEGLSLRLVAGVRIPFPARAFVVDDTDGPERLARNGAALPFVGLDLWATAWARSAR